MSNNNDKCLHFAMCPWFALGHLTSFLHLANKLAERGHKISFFLPTKTQFKLPSNNLNPNLITFLPISVPHVDGLPAGAETTNDVPAPSRIKIMEAMDLTQNTMDSHLAKLKPDYVFFDFAQWVPKLARKHGAKSIYYISTYVVSCAYSDTKGRNLPFDYRYTEAILANPPPGFPCPLVKLRAPEARITAYVANLDSGGGMTLAERYRNGFRECDVIAVKTCREIEGAYCDFVQKLWDKPILLVGPVMPEQSSSTLDDHFDKWLNGFDHGSVVYCALGSECILEMNQFQELVLGLELTGRPFLAALKPPNGYDTVESALPEGYMKRVEKRGIIHGGWVQQQLILKHPSVGCFITHCGAGSLSEALLSECQLVMMPQAVDQFLNARMMCLDLKLGVEVAKEEQDCFSTRDDVRNAIEMVMEPESDVGKEVRANHTKCRNVLLKQGLEDSYINEFVRSLQDLVG